VALILIAACHAEGKPDPVALGYQAQQRGLAALQREDYTAAEQAFLEAAWWSPDDAYTQLDLGVAEQRLGRFAAAREAYQRAEELGQHVMPLDVTNPRYGGLTVAQLANENMAALEGPKPAH
jgi:tetratricopeptide (TPR) repeat protein